MAQFNVNDADRYGGQGGGGYFRLVNDKDTAQVRFLYDSIDDVEGYAVHEITLNDKKRYVNCLREYNDSVEACPFCKANRFVTVKYYVPLFNLDTNRVETWERGKKFGQKLSSLCARYPHLVQHVFEIERNGKVGDTQTTYEIYPLDGVDEDVKLEDFTVPSPLGSHVLDKSFDELQYFVDHHDTFPEDDDAPIRRRSSSDYEERSSRDSERTQERRRTPIRDDSETF